MSQLGQWRPGLGSFNLDQFIRFIYLIVCAAVFTLVAAEPASGLGYSLSMGNKHYDEEHEVSPNVYRVNDFMYRGGRLDAERFATLKKLGVKTIISVCVCPWNKKRDDILCKQFGLRCCHLPFWILGPRTEQIDAFMRLCEEARKSPTRDGVYIHCHDGNDRTGCLVGVYRVVKEGWSIQQAYQEMLKYGYDPHFTRMAAIFRRYALAQTKATETIASVDHPDSPSTMSSTQGDDHRLARLQIGLDL